MENGLRFILMFMVTVICFVYFVVCLSVMIRCCIGLGESIDGYKPMDVWNDMRERMRKRRRMNVVIIYPVPEALETTEYPVQEAHSSDIMDAVEVI